MDPCRSTWGVQASAPTVERVPIPVKRAQGAESYRRPYNRTRLTRLSGSGLLILDNCEHMILAAAQFAEGVLAACAFTMVCRSSF